jgi:hypothetical protein
MFPIIESFRPFFETEKDLQTKKLHALLETLLHHKNKIPTIDLFNLIYQLLDLHQPKQEIFEKVGPFIELKFGDKQCCSYKFGIDAIAGSKNVAPKRCVGQKLPGFLYCQKHNENEVKTCWRCRQHYKRDIIHHYGWEHFGNIFESDLRARTWMKNAEQLGIDYSTLISFSQKTFGGVSKPSVPKQIDLRAAEPTEPTKITISDFEKQQMSLHLLQYMLSNHLIKVSNKHPLTEIKLFDMDEVLLDDGDFIFKMMSNKCRVVGIRKDMDSILMKDGLLDLKPEYSECSDAQILNFVNMYKIS